LDDLRIYTDGNYNGSLTFTLTAVAQENDGSVQFNTSEEFVVTFLSPTPGNGTGGNGTTLLPPTLDVFEINSTQGTNIALEDGQLVINLNATEGAGETLNPVITVVISDVPSDWTVIGATFNPITGDYIASAEDIQNGLVRVQAPKDFSGFYNLTVEAVAIASGDTTQTATSGQETLELYFDPVADGFNVVFQGSDTSVEDGSYALDVTFSQVDVQEFFYSGIYAVGNVSSWYYIFFDDPTVASISGFQAVALNDTDAEFWALQGFNLTGYYRIPVGTNGVPIDFLENWHGNVTIDVRVPIIETEYIQSLNLDALESDHFILSSG
jgi:hypothetical protein